MTPRGVPVERITSPANPRVKSLTALRRRRVRDESGMVLVDGRDELAMALAAGVVPRAVYLCPELLPADGWPADRVAAEADAAGSEVVELGRAAFEKASYRQGPDGVLAVVPAPSRHLAELPTQPNGIVLICQGVEKPGNLGAMLRSADAAGVIAVIAADPVTDWGNPNVIRASRGTVFTVPTAATRTAELLDWVACQGLRLVVTTPEAATDYTRVDYRGPVAIAVGSERDGADRTLLSAADERVRIPMSGRADSLNVAVSAAVVLFEAVRQRHG